MTEHLCKGIDAGPDVVRSAAVCLGVLARDGITWTLRCGGVSGSAVFVIQVNDSLSYDLLVGCLLPSAIDAVYASVGEVLKELLIHESNVTKRITSLSVSHQSAFLVIPASFLRTIASLASTGWLNLMCCRRPLLVAKLL